MKNPFELYKSPLKVLYAYGSKFFHYVVGLQPVMQPATARDAGSSSAECVTHQFLCYIEELMTGASAAGLTNVTASSVIEHFTSALSSRQSELSAAKVIKGSCDDHCV